MEVLDIYNSLEEKTGRTIIRGERFKEGDLYLAVHVWIKNGKKYLIQQRPMDRGWMREFGQLLEVFL